MIFLLTPKGGPFSRHLENLTKPLKITLKTPKIKHDLNPKYKRQHSRQSSFFKIHLTMKACPQIAKKERFATAAKTLPALQNLSNRILKIHKYIKTDIKIYFRVF